MLHNVEQIYVSDQPFAQPGANMYINYVNIFFFFLNISISARLSWTDTDKPIL